MTMLLRLSAGKKPRKPPGSYVPPITGFHAVPFFWEAVGGATSYVLRIGPSSGSYTTFDANVGNVLTYELSLQSGTYYARVVPQGAGSQTDEQMVTV